MEVLASTGGSTAVSGLGLFSATRHFISYAWNASRKIVYRAGPTASWAIQPNKPGADRYARSGVFSSTPDDSQIGIMLLLKHYRRQLTELSVIVH
jgi:hypothetical protein